MECETFEYHQLLTESFNHSSNLYSISKFAPEQWLSDQVKEYKYSLYKGINDDKKTVRRISIIDTSHYSSQSNRESKSFRRLVSLYLNEAGVDKRGTELEKYLMLRDSCYAKYHIDVLEIFSKIHSSKKHGLLVDDKNKKKVAAIYNLINSIGGEHVCDELLIYDNKIIISKYNEENKRYKIEELTEQDKVIKTKNLWMSAFNSFAPDCYDIEAYINNMVETYKIDLTNWSSEAEKHFRPFYQEIYFGKTIQLPIRGILTNNNDQYIVENMKV
jgi:hypothetical protein